MRIVAYTVLILMMLVMFEAVLMAMFSGHLYIQFKSPLIDNAGFFWALLQDDPGSTVRLLLVEKPVFIIQSQHTATDTTLWALHYFSITLLIHGLVAYLLADIFKQDGMETRLRAIPITGTGLLLLSSLYLVLAGCCTGGPNWMVQTWILALVFNPINSSNATIQFYQSIKDWFVVLQVMSGILGGYLILRHKGNRFEFSSLIGLAPQK